ncbi:MAG: 16S rRNA (uracil(1498)-N(3))-methyltransferase [Clostridia bacterium]|nr:16S rRNA (uracil(1498)-N(3))-methyltransferase [Clostridia bacterium]
MPRFFKELPAPASVGDALCIDGADGAHIRRSLRMTVGDAVTVSDGAGYDYDTVIEAFDGDSICLRVRARTENRTEPTLRVTLYQGLPKGDKLEQIIQKSVELGVSEIVPVALSRSIAKVGDKAAQKQARWQKIADEAAGQSGRGCLPTVSQPISVDELVRRAAEQKTIVCYEAGGEPLRALVSPDDTRLSLVIGPEGGLAPEEVARLQDAGARVATLGPRILRTETAPVAALAVLMQLSGNLD